MLSNSSVEESESESKASKADVADANVVVTVAAKYVISNCFKRHAIMKDGEPLAITCSVVASVDA
jgi:hypothetical protein